MSKSLTERLLRGRQTTTESGGWTFTVRRPSPLERHEFSGKLDQRLLLTRFVVDWGAVSEIDLGIPGGGPELVPFEAGLWGAWIEDHPEHWSAITQAVVDGYLAYEAELEAALKNSAPGSEA